MTLGTKLTVPMVDFRAHGAQRGYEGISGRISGRGRSESEPQVEKSTVVATRVGLC